MSRTDDADIRALRATLADVRAQQQSLFAELGRGQQRFRTLARSTWQVGEDERRRLARELHDGLGQNLTALWHLLERAQATATPETREPLDQALSLARATLEEVRALAQALRPRILDDLGLPAALAWLARTMAAAGGYAAQVDCADPLPDVDDAVATLLFRIAQEALTNVNRHAACTCVVVRLSTSADMLSLLVADDGRGFDPAAQPPVADGQAGGSGLRGMRERLALFGGELEIGSTPGGGTRVRARVHARAGTSP